MSQFSSQMVPGVGFAIVAPAPLWDSARFMRMHNRASKDAVRTTLLNHRLKRIPGHFKRGNRQKYDHAPRKSSYRDVKRIKFHSTTDLVKTGKTRDRMTSEFPQIRVGGSAQSVMRGTMQLSFPFPANLEDNRDGVTVAQMAKEIGAWTESESKEAAKEIGEFFAEALEVELAKAPRLRKKVMPKI